MFKTVLNIEDIIASQQQELSTILTYTNIHYLAVSDEKCGDDEAEDQRSEYHRVTELKKPDTQKATHLNKVQSGHLEQKHSDTIRASHLLE